MTKFNELKYESLAHPPYSTDLATSDYHRYRNLPQFLRGKRFSSNKEAVTAACGKSLKGWYKINGGTLQ